MPIITDRNEVLDIYKEVGELNWVLPCFCTENLTTTEAILDGVKSYGEKKGIKNLPIIIAITNLYDHRTQSVYYTHTRRWDIGLKLFMQDLKILTDEGAPYEDLRVMIHLDHIQFDDDRELLSWYMRPFSSIMFDASKVSFNENMELTRQFVKEQGSQIVIEGACDEIVDATGKQKSELTTPERAEEYMDKTGVDLIVANLGTEHRASSTDLTYHGDIASRIKEKIGTKIVLHGASSVKEGQIADLFDDGVCKVNIWTALERDSSPVLLKSMIENASKIDGPEASLSHFTTVYRQNIIFSEMKKIITGYLKLWYKIKE
jgi:fructose/tagatose bisphosphate aldolase